MYGSDKASDEVERTAFRQAEKKYKLYYEDAFKSSKKYLSSLLFVVLFDLVFFYSSFVNNRKKKPKQVDLSEVLDFKSILELYNEKAQLSPAIFVLQCGFNRPVFCLEDRPGKLQLFNFILLIRLSENLLIGND